MYLSHLPFPDETLEFSEMQSQPDLSELPNELSLFTPKKSVNENTVTFADQKLMIN